MIVKHRARSHEHSCVWPKSRGKDQGRERRSEGRRDKGREGEARLGSLNTKETKTHHQPHTPLPQAGDLPSDPARHLLPLL